MYGSLDGYNDGQMPHGALRGYADQYNALTGGAPAQTQAPGVNTFNPTQPPAAPGMMTPGYIPADPTQAPGQVGMLPGWRMPAGNDGGAGTQVPGQPVQALAPGTSTQPGNVAATAPLPFQQFGSIAQVAPSYVDPANAQAYYQQYQQMLAQSMQPYFTQQQQQLEQDLRARGIQNSGAAGELEGNLLGEQGATLAGQSAPFLQEAFGYNQQADLANAGYGNAASYYNADAYRGATTANYDAYNNYLNEMLGLGASNTGSLQAAYLNSYGPNTGVTSAYNNALAGTQNVFGNVYGAASNSQGQALGGAFSGLGQFAAAGGFG